MSTELGADSLQYVKKVSDKPLTYSCVWLISRNDWPENPGLINDKLTEVLNQLQATHPGMTWNVVPTSYELYHGLTMLTSCLIVGQSSVELMLQNVMVKLVDKYMADSEDENKSPYGR